MKDSEIAEILKRENEEYRRLCEEHRNLEQILAELDKNKYLTPEEEIKRKDIQKQKLAKKDRMAELIREYRKLKVQSERSHEK